MERQVEARPAFISSWSSLPLRLDSAIFTHLFEDLNTRDTGPANEDALSELNKLDTETIGESATAPVPRPRALRRLWRIETYFVVALAAFAVLAILASLNPYFGWDLFVSRRFNWRNIDSPALLAAMRFISTIGNRWIPYAITTITAILFLLFRRRSEAAALVFSTAGSGLVNSLLKILIARPRPAPDLIPAYRDMMTQSFPSGHVTFFVCYFGFLFFVSYALLRRGSLARKFALTITAVFVALIGSSRVYLGAHWPSDTIGAYLWSGVWLGISLWLYRRWKQERTFHRAQRSKSSESVESSESTETSDRLRQTR